ncbi:hypothetical protein ACFL1X_02835 [Candidatus Hydrogenedentota bacterium]
MIQGERNIARAKKYYIALGILCTGFFSLGIVGSIVDSIRNPADWEDGGCAVIVITFACFTALGVYILLASLVRYEWNDEELKRITVFGSGIMKWDDVVSFRIRRILGAHTYFLYDRGQQELCVDIQLTGENYPLHQELKRRLAPITNKAVDLFAQESNKTVPLKVLGIKSGELIFEDDCVIHKKLFSRKVVRHEDVMFVFKEARYHSGQKLAEMQVLSDGDRDLLVLDAPRIASYDIVVEYLKRKVPDAFWVDMTSTEEPHSPVAALGYKARSRRKLKQPMLAVAVVTVFILFLAGKIGMALLRHPEIWQEKSGDIICAASLLGFLGVLILWGLVKTLMKRRQLQKDITRLKHEIAENPSAAL